MKRIWQHPEEPKTGRRYWRSIGELERRESFLNNLGREFPNGDELTEEERESSRRNFLKLMGASVGMMGLASCRRPLTNILPFTKGVEWIVPGKPLLYATTMPSPYGATPMVVTTHEGRPTHLSGNPLHPSVGGGLGSFAQASILDLYDPERSQKVKSNGATAKWEAVDEALAKLSASGGDGVGILVGAEISPTLSRLRGEVLKKLSKAKFFQYEAISRDKQQAVNKELLGAGTQPVVKLNKALAILSLDCDFLGLEPVSDDSEADFVKNRQADRPAEADKMCRLYAIENRYTLTGAMADHRKPLPATLLPVAAALLAAEIGKLAGDTALAQAAAALSAPADGALFEWIRPAAADLFKNKGKAVVLAGSRTSEAVQALAAGINGALGAFGSVIELFKGEASTSGSFTDLAAAVNGGAIHTVLSFTGSDPVFDSPASLGFAKAIADKKVSVIHHGTRFNATAKAAALHIPGTHYLETWGDARTLDGVYSIVQPMIQPLYNGVSELEVYLALLGKKTFGAAKPAAAGAKPAAAPAGPVEDPAYEAVRETFGAAAGGLNENKWNLTLRDGFLKDSAGIAGGTFNSGAVAGIVSKAKAPSAPNPDALEVVLVPDSSIWDGRYINNGWLQEAPDPVTKLTWDNAALIGSVTYHKLQLRAQKEGLTPQIKITVEGKSIVIPALEAPGHASNSITIQLGYGQKVTGFIGKEAGVDGYSLLSATGEYVLNGATVHPTGEEVQLAITQEYDTMAGRALYREGTSESKENFAQITGLDAHIPQSVSLYGGQFGPKTAENPAGFDFETHHQWGMSIDLSKCTGCTACLIACQSENNIPIVGKDQVRKGRVMHWIRMDRYFATPEPAQIKEGFKPEALETAEMVHQPVACQHCESAPCETVCPVNATVHTEEGLNAMAYNRCIGTRYCANNCPYTARRFNWFDYNKRPLDELYWGPLSTPEKTGMRESLKLQKNPNVSVRMRGVIEKCTYCVQRLESAKIQQLQVQRDSKNFRVPTDSVKVACQQACSMGAIEFGNIADRDSKVSKIKGDDVNYKLKAGETLNPGSPRNYQLLKYINTRPRTSYLARIRNVNPAMPGHEGIAAWSKKNF